MYIGAATTENNTRWPKFDESGAADVDQNWVIEEARLRGGYNNVSVGYGVKAYAVEPNPNASLLINGLIFSGISNGEIKFPSKSSILSVI